MMNIGKRINDGYCNGFFGRRYDLRGSIIEGEGRDWIVVRIEDEGVVDIASFPNSEDKQEYIDKWTASDEDENDED